MVRREFLLNLGRGVTTLMVISLVEGCERTILTPLTSGTDIPFLTGTDTFFVQNGAQGALAGWSMPSLDPAAFRLSVEGFVAEPRTFTMDDIGSLAASTEEITFLKTLQCVFEAPLLSSATGLTGNAFWTGVPLKRLIDACGGFSAGAVRLRLFGADGFRNNITIERFLAVDPEVLPPTLVTRMNDAPLTRAHGAPLRLILPEGFGFKSVKWLTRIEVVDSDAPFGTYQDNGFTDTGVLAVTSRATRPLANSGLRAGAVEIGGIALSGAGGIAAVDIRIDGGAWEPAEILTPDAARLKDAVPWERMEQVKRFMTWPYRGVWTLWRTTWIARPGSHTLEVRATDSSGAVQPAVDRNPADGTNGIASIKVLVT